MDQFIQTVLSNVFVALILALVAALVGRLIKRPQIAHMIWLLVLVKLITPPVVTIPLISVPEQFDNSIIASGIMPLFNLDNVFSSEISIGSIGHWISFINSRNAILITIWILGSLLVLGLSLKRVYKFNWLLKTESEPAPPNLKSAVERIAGKLNLDNMDILTTSAHLSPMVWWTGGKVKVLIPASLLDKMEPEDFEWILAHELAHVRRHDYLTRWLEWLTMVIYWWNPLTYWAIHSLRKYEELCCDALVVKILNPELRSYTGSLLKAVEVIRNPDLRAPAMATEINSGGFLQKRFKLILSNNLNTLNLRWLQVIFTICAFSLLPLSIGCEKGNVGITSTGHTDETNNGRTNQAESDREREPTIEDHFRGIGVDEDLFDSIRSGLTDRGIDPTEQVMGGMLRVIWEVKSEGEGFELDPRMREYFENTIQLTSEQIELVLGLARRAVHSMKDLDNQRVER